MDKMTYANEVAEIVGGEAREVTKANGVIKTGIVVGDSTIRPTVYIDEMYDNGLSVSEAAEKVTEMAENAKSSFDLPDFNNYDAMKPYLRARLYNKKTKADIKRSAKSRGFDDLVIIPYLDEIIENGSARITRQMADIWGVSDKEIIDQALKNSGDFEIRSMAEMLAEMTGMPADLITPTPLKVLTNKAKVFGAIAAVTARKELKKMFPDGYVIIPSSVHEVLVMPYDSEMSDELTGIIGNVNDECVSAEEVLGTHPYVFAA